MRRDKAIDYTAGSINDDEKLIRLLCSPLQYDKTTHQVSVDAFDLRLLGKNGDNPEPYTSLIRCKCFSKEEDLVKYLYLGYRIWDDKPSETNTYYGYATFLCADARAVSPIIEIWPLKGDKPVHIGMFFVQDEYRYYKGPLPKSDPVILEMLGDLSELIADSIIEAPVRNP